MVTIKQVLRACRCVSEDESTLEVLMRQADATRDECAQAMDDALRAHLVRFCEVKRRVVMTSDGQAMFRSIRN